uniref:Acetyl CoA carboxylase 1a n=1 Tax=Amphidinium carterae TaxID=2961 RepID=A0A1Z2RP62_AMPCA|nr:acetyl CoA carboxylase 1a [Amphidinium carterae]
MTAAAGGGLFATAVAAQRVGARRSQKKSGARRRTNVVQMSVATLEQTSTSTTAEKVLADYVEKYGGNRPLRRILIANNGMAATKAMLSMRQWAYVELGLDRCFEFVAMATPDDLDANAEFIRLADTYVEVPGGKNSNNYANVDLICKVAEEQKVDAVWPGWGHASENPKLPMSLTKMGIAFIGPTSPVMSVLGDKIAANILAQTAGVNSIPWSGDGLEANLTEEGTIPDEIFQKGLINTLEEAKACAERIGYPVMLKASEGGGGKGIRMSANAQELEANYPQVLAEVPGSPVFMMQLCQGARHIEVQIVGDMHGNAVALNGRDCTTQRRFQKIFEEGPPSIVPKATFREMEKAAQRLTQSIGYIGAGTVEYLFNADSGEYYFLELNPRLQVEHPVTEEISGVNMPATQAQVLMGIPLARMPQIRRFYGKSPDDLDSPIDFLEDDYVYPDSHVIAARITAENPDDGFKPTSGAIRRIKFQSSVSCWGYFSIGANGAIHEYADSQFGHIFARGKDREESRKVLQLALRQLDITGDIRNPVEYLVQLLDTKAFTENDITTSWLDGLLKNKSISAQYDFYDIVFYAAVFRAMAAFEAKAETLAADLKKRQFGGLRDMSSWNKTELEITFEGMKYAFQVERAAADRLLISINGTTVDTRVRAQPDGSIFVSVGNSVMKIAGNEEALGLRLQLAGIATVMLPTIYDPSELRSEFNGKVVRYLQGPGETVKEGQAYVELEAMKMIMPLKAAATGKFAQSKQPGSIVSAGELLGELELEDTSNVTKIENFTGDFNLSAVEMGDATTDPEEQVMLALDGYIPTASPAELVQQLFSTVSTSEQPAMTAKLVEKFLAVESDFASLSAEMASPDQVLAEIVAKNVDEPEKAIQACMAHSRLATRSEIILAALRASRRYGATAELVEDISKLAKLPTKKGYDEVVLFARQLAKTIDERPFDERLSALKESMTGSPSTESIVAMSKWSALRAGVDLLSQLLTDESKEVRMVALETYIRRIYRGFAIADMDVTEDDNLMAKFTFQYPGVAGVTRSGTCVVLPEAKDIETFLSSSLPVTTGEGDAPVNSLQVVVGPSVLGDRADRVEFNSTDAAFESEIKAVESMLSAASSALTEAGIRDFCFTIPQAPHFPRYASFLAKSEWKEDVARRDMRPTFPYLLEVSRLAETMNLERITPTVGRNSQVYIGTLKDEKPGSPGTVFVRVICNTPMEVDMVSDDWMVLPESRLLQALDEVERALLNKPANQVSNSQIFLHMMSLVDLPVQEVDECFELFMNKFVSRYGSRLQQLRVDDIVVKIGLGSEATGRTETLRFVASSMTGEYLKTVGLIESHDPVTGQPVKWVEVEQGSERQLTVAADPKIKRKRAMARRAGSTYAPEFLGMLKVGLIEKWTQYLQSVGSSQMPAEIFEAQELVTGADGKLELVERVPGENDIGMLAWRCTLQSPEYPKGRDIVLIANDITHQAGSFGVAEDEFFQKASAYARENGLPRIFISCNSGARVGLVEELKPHIKVAWTDEKDPTKGFEYLYITEETYKEFGDKVVEAHAVDADGEKRYVLDAVIGEGLKSTSGGIGVENLRGSGLIAGETSRAYDEIFTLSYITGRSVGIGAYLNRLGQRTIQMVNGPMILTGFGALNKLLGKTVYTSQDQLGGPQVMVPNGVTHQLVQNDQEGVGAILDWLAYVPKDSCSIPPMIKAADPVDRDVTFTPSKTPYDPRNMLAGQKLPDGTKLTGFFDDGSFKEYLGGWGRSVVVGRAKLGGIPMGVIAVETRNVDRKIPADPANPDSSEVVEPQAGQVWFPDSAFKTATALRDFNRGENLPVMIFANWRGFSGGTRDMYGEVLKFGAQIVDALVEYKHPVFVYIPPGGELRGGSWVVIDPSINPQQMEMYADVESRGGILEPAGIVEVKFRQAQQTELMHRTDEKLQALDAELEAASSEDEVSDIEQKIKAREEKLRPLFTQIAAEFADLHDRTGRMEAVGVIRKGLEWRTSRKFFYDRVRRRLLEKDLVNQLMAADSSMSEEDAASTVASWMPSDNDEEVATFLDTNPMSDSIKNAKVQAIEKKIESLKAELEAAEA